MRERRAILGLMGAASAALHAGAVVVLGALALRAGAPRAARAAVPEPARAAPAVVGEAPFVAEGAIAVEREPDHAGEPVVPAGGELVPRVDDARRGAGGDRSAAEPAIHMAPRDEELRRTTDTLSRLDRDQVQRLRTAKERASWEDTRTTTKPAELTFLASGQGTLRERRAPAPTMPSRGALAAPEAAIRGAALGAKARVEADAEAHGPAGGARVGSAGSSPGVGVAAARPGADHRVGAPLAEGRPDLVRGAPSVQARARARPRDVVDSQQEVATTVRSLVHASTFGGQQGATGRGGVGGGGSPAAGGAAGEAGASARPLGVGQGAWLDYDAHDPRFVDYFRHLHARIDPLWRDAFPRSAVAEQHGGTAILDFVVHGDGSVTVSWPPRRPSGFPEFDARCAEAVRRAAPFDPPPASLGPEVRVRAPFVVKNPLVE